MMRRSLAAAAVLAVSLGSAVAAPSQSPQPTDFFGFAALFSGAGNVAGTSPFPRHLGGLRCQIPAGQHRVNTAQRRLYFVTAPGQAMEYGVGVGRDGFQWSGVKTVSAKKEWPPGRRRSRC